LWRKLLIGDAPQITNLRHHREKLMEQRTVTHHRWNDIPEERLSDVLSRKLITGDRMMLAHVYLKKGAVVPRHSHENEQITYILEGGLRFWIGLDEAQVIDVRAGEVLHIPSHVPHKAEALEDTLDVDVFSPPRQDWLDKTDDYLRPK
jgi:quercetin dioxygenase-like cupin family protein